MSAVRKVRTILRNPNGHWVGDGFPVRTLFAYPNMGTQLSPFLMLDYGGPTQFEATDTRRGVGAHPHRGFETVTIVYDGEIEHRDSAGGGGKIGPGDVQWMTAASGLVHEEFHGRDYAKRGGPFEMVQLWVNLPAKDKLSQPSYQGIVSNQIPEVKLADGAGTARLIAGSLNGQRGPARTFTPINMWDLRLNTQQSIELPVDEGHTALLVLLKGSVTLAGGVELKPAEAALFERDGAQIQIESAQNVRALLLSGEPINEPIVGQGPFVMNTPAEIRQAISDYQSGKMGHLN